MTIIDTSTYFVALIAISLAPGPVVLMLMVRAASNDMRGAMGFALGTALACVLIITAVCFGLGTWLSAVPQVFEYSKYAMMAYFLWLAYGIWKGGYNMNSTGGDSHQTLWSSICTGIVTSFISPYYMILFPLVLPEIMDITIIRLPEFAVVGVLTFVAVAASSALVICFAAQLRRFARSPRSMLILNRSLASILVSVGGVMVFA